MTVQTNVKYRANGIDLLSIIPDNTIKRIKNTDFNIVDMIVIVLDPAAGGFSVYDSCIETGGLFLGCDLVFGDEKLKEKSGDFLCAA